MIHDHWAYEDEWQDEDEPTPDTPALRAHHNAVPEHRSTIASHHNSHHSPPGARKMAAPHTHPKTTPEAGRMDASPVSRQVPASWTLTLPWDAPPVKPNGGHGNVYAHAAKVKRTRQTMGLLARQAGIPWLGRCEVSLTWFVPDRRKRDADNLVWTLKPICDALAGTKVWDHQVVEDDTPEFMVKPMPAIVYDPDGPKRLVVTIAKIDDGQ